MLTEHLLIAIKPHPPQHPNPSNSPPRNPAPRDQETPRAAPIQSARMTMTIHTDTGNHGRFSSQHLNTALERCRCSQSLAPPQLHTFARALPLVVEFGVRRVWRGRLDHLSLSIWHAFRDGERGMGWGRFVPRECTVVSREYGGLGWNARALRVCTPCNWGCVGESVSDGFDLVKNGLGVGGWYC